MSKPKRSGIGFSAAKTAAEPKQQITKSSADHTAKEQQAVALINQGKLQEAEAIYRDLIATGTNNHNVYGKLGALLTIRGDIQNAITYFNKSIELKPNYLDAHYNLGVALQMEGDLTEAITSYKVALKLKPNYPEAHFNLGIVLHEQGDLDAAITSYNKSLQLKPNYPEAHNNLGNALKAHGRITEAINSYHKALKLKPDYPEAQKNLSMAELINGDYSCGLARYEYRLKCEKERAKLSANPLTRYWSEPGIAECSQLLVISEQGLGDTLQFMRYIINLKNKGIFVSFCAPKKLHTLIQASGIDQVPLTPQQANNFRDGHWIPLLSLPKHLEISPQNPIITSPYIKTSEELINKWKGILRKEQRPIIGINWQGNPSHERLETRGRSLPLETFMPITHKTNSSLLALQKGFGSEQLEICSFNDRFVSCQNQINETWDFLETAAIIANCDLVITSDTSVAHLAGGMGKTTWLLLHKVPNWRWGLEGEMTFWYHSMRLFRQRERGNWDEVMERVAVALEEHFVKGLAPTQPAKDPQPANRPEPIQDILAPISLGELVDKITILKIKTQHLQGTALKNVKKELEALETTLNDLQLNIDPTLIKRLKEVNQDLWQIEDDIRQQESEKRFGETFIRLARSVYQQNDRRAAIKKEINTSYGSTFVEEKSYKKY